MVSPGLFPEGDSPELHLSGEAVALNLRNPKIADALFRAGVIEQYGSGIPRIKCACEEAGVAFEYADMPNFTALVFHRPGSQLEDTPTEMDKSGSQDGRRWPKMAEGGRTARERTILQLASRGTTTVDAAAELGVSERTARRLIAHLVEDGLLVVEGSTSNRVYYLAEKG